MPFMFAPILFGAALGGISSAIMGQDPLKGALLGAAGGGLGSAAGLFGGAAGAGANASAGALGSIGNSAGTLGATAASAAPSLLPTTIAPTLATTQGAAAASSPLFGYTASAASPMLGSAASAIPTAAEIGAGFGADAISSMVSPSMFSDLSKYATIDNLIGAGNVMSRFQPTPRSPAPQGRITEGKLPQGGIGSGGVEGLLAELQKRQQQQYQPISLL
jgi:hypothetical protein